ncbi:tripartite tricarboxylate transporter TctB family protein [Pseudomonas sp. FW300-N2F2]|uniref:tripartite tricarboxylate transporter TctB family protein n=1 Tax=Pseudomonas sp. FW300-N2F2 TaxID=2751320 RepID=UPI001A912503|nr:tripartite tricarboxylate transporter TctB family protein [Pseudomonas sp. FW300-N2F2]
MSDSKVGGFFKAVVMWLFFALFLVIGLAAMFTSFLSGLIMLLAACIFVPQVNRAIKDKVNIIVTPGARTVVALVCFGLFFYSSNEALDTSRIQRQAQEALVNQQKAEQAQKEKYEYVAANQDAILAEMNAMIAKKDYSGATALGGKYSNAGSFEIDQALSKVSAQKADADKQQRKATLLTSLSNIKQDDYKGLASTYSQLASIDQTYQANADKFSKLAEQHAQEQKAREQVASDKARRKSLGLTWNYADGEDKMSGEPVRQAYVSSINTVDFKFPYGGVQRATLTIRKHPRWGTSVYVAIEKGQFVCGYDDCDVRVRFSKGNAQRMSASEPDDHSSNLLFISNAASFIAQARRSDKVFVEADFYQEGSRVFEFDVSDLEWK